MRSVYDPFLNMGVIMAFFHSEGIDPCSIDAKKRKNKLGVNSSGMNLRYLVGRPSGPATLQCQHCLVQ